MAKKTVAPISITQQRFNDLSDLETKYKDNALPLFGLALYIQADDLDALANEALTDGGNDKKIDFCYIDRSAGYAVVAQGFCSKTWGKQSADGNKATDLISAIGWLLTGNMDDVPEKLRDSVRELRDAIKEKEINRLEFLYIHNCMESKNVDEELKTAVNLAATLLKDTPISISAKELGIDNLDSLCLANESQIFVTETMKFSATNTIEESGPAWKSVVATVKGDWLHQLMSQHGPHLFRANYREFLGVRNSAKNINNGIKKSVQTDADNFWTYNNGITALARKIDKKKGKFTIEDISIINGAQTTGSIGECTHEQARDVNVLCRFVQCADKEVLHKIIKFNNTQNAFRTSDQRSNDAIQKRLATDLVPYGLSYVHRRTVTQNANGSISAESVAPMLCSFHGDPQTAARWRDDIFDSDSVYQRVFPNISSGEHLVFVHCLGIAIDEVKLSLKIKTNTGTATPTEVKNYEVLKHSTSKLFLAAIMGEVIDEILGKKVPDRYSVKFTKNTIKKDLEKLVFAWKEAVEAVVPFVGSVVGDKSYEASRQFSKLKEIGKQVATYLNAGGASISNRFAQLRDVTEW